MIVSPCRVEVLNDRGPFPFMLVEPMIVEDELTGQTWEVPKYFRTDGSSVPGAIVALPVVGPALFMRFFGAGVFQGFKQGAFHDYLRRPDRKTGKPPVPAALAHRMFRSELYAAGYPPDLCELYYHAVVVFNS